MSKEMLRLVWQLLSGTVRREQHDAVQMAKIRLATWYVKAVKAGRTAFLGIVGLMVLAMLLIGGFVLLNLGLCFYVPWETERRAVVLMVLGAIYLAIPLFTFAFLARQKFWMHATGADKAVNDALVGKPRCRKRA